MIPDENPILVTKIFISYMRVIPDQILAYFLVDYLVDRGHSVFVDTNIPLALSGPRKLDVR